LARLGDAGSTRLILISAPSGSGKSTLAASWMVGLDTPAVWLSLDEGDDDLARFLLALISAVQTVYPNFAPELLDVANRGGDLAPETVARRLREALEDLPSGLAIALDDYHTIRSRRVHDLVGSLLKRPVQGLTLLLSTRFDPPLNLGGLRASGAMREIRARDLEFDADEAGQLLEVVSGGRVPRKLIEVLTRRVEGWGAGLRLAGLALRDAGTQERMEAELRSATELVQDYLMEVFLGAQSEEFREFLLMTSLLPRLSASLCDRVLAQDPSAVPGLSPSQRLLDEVRGQGMFLVELDRMGRWMRYHHLFGDLLRQQLERTRSPEEIQRIRVRAGEWFEAEGYLEEAIEQYLAAGLPERAADAIESSRTDLMAAEEWRRLERVLALLPADVGMKRPALLLARSWELEQHALYEEAVTSARTAVEVLSATDPHRERLPEVWAESDAVLAIEAYLKGDGAGAVGLAQRALDGLGAAAPVVRGFALAIMALGEQVTSGAGVARRLLLAALSGGEPGYSPVRARIYIAMGLIQWLECDPEGIQRSGRALLEMSGDGRKLLPEGFGRYFLGVAALVRGDFEGGVAALEPLLAERDLLDPTNHVQGALAAAASLSALGHIAEASNLVAEVEAYTLRSGNQPLHALVLAFKAEEDLTHGQAARAFRWASTNPSVGPAAHFRFFLGGHALARVLVAEGTPSSLERARDLLQDLEMSHRRWRAGPHLVTTLLLQAWLAQRQGRTEEGVELVAEAVSLARPGPIREPFLRLRAELQDVFSRTLVHVGGSEFLSNLLGEESGPGAQPGPEAPRQAQEGLLSARELEVLACLPEGASDKAIARELFIAPGTVKKHLKNIYRKLGVHSREEAVARGRSLHLLS
jgi:LuxR family maltose regulon positive regulatory protein